MPHYEKFYKIITETTDGNIFESLEFTDEENYYGYISPINRLSQTVQQIGKNGGFYIDQKTLTAYPVKRVYVKTRTRH